MYAQKCDYLASNTAIFIAENIYTKHLIFFRKRKPVLKLTS